MQSNVPTSSPEFLEGSKACFQVVRELVQSDAIATELPLDLYFAWRDRTLAKILKTAGPVSNSAAGVISLLTELILDLKDDMMFADVATWQPESILPDAERKEKRNALIEE
jgi:hypothetical protein